MAISKVIYGNQTLIDITSTDASATSVQVGRKFYNSAGEAVTGIGSALGHEIEVLPNGGIAHHITGVDLCSDSVDASHLANGYTAHNKNGVAIVGTLNTGPLQMGVIRPDAELISTFSYDKLWAEDDKQNIPAYTTTATTFYTGAALSPVIALSLGSYKYYVLIRCLTIPIYNTATNEKGRFDYSMTMAAYEIFDIVGNTIQTTTGTKISSRNNVVVSAGATYRGIYWTSNAAAALSTSSGYGLHQTVAAPALSSSTSASPNLTIKDPNLYVRGSDTYFSSSAWAKMTDIRRQYVINVYRVPVGNDIKGWMLYSQFDHIVDCVNNHNFKLT